MLTLKKEFKIFKDADGVYYGVQNPDKTLVEISLDVRRPTYQNQREAQFHYSKAFSEAIKNKVPSKLKMEQILKENGDWTEDDDKIAKEMTDEIRRNQKKLLAGKIKKSEAEKLAWENIKRSEDYLAFCSKKNQYFDKCAESIAEQAKFNYLTYACTVYNNNGKQFWKSYEDFLEDNNKNPLVVNVSGALLASLIYNMDNDYRSDWPEYQFLKKYKYVNDNFEKLDKDGNTIKVDEDFTDIQTIETAEFFDD